MIIYYLLVNKDFIIYLKKNNYTKQIFLIQLNNKSETESNQTEIFELKKYNSKNIISIKNLFYVKLF